MQVMSGYQMSQNVSASDWQLISDYDQTLFISEFQSNCGFVS